MNSVTNIVSGASDNLGGDHKLYFHGPFILLGLVFIIWWGPLWYILCFSLWEGVNNRKVRWEGDVIGKEHLKITYQNILFLALIMHHPNGNFGDNAKFGWARLSVTPATWERWLASVGLFFFSSLNGRGMKLFTVVKEVPHDKCPNLRYVSNFLYK